MEARGPETMRPGPGAFGKEIRHRAISVLVVDSNTASRSTTESLLRDCGFEASAVQTAKQALALLETRPGFDCVLKQHEPGQNIDATKLLRRIASSPHAAVKRIPFIVTSTCVDEDVVRRCLRLGALDYLIQPLRVNELLVLGTKIARSSQGTEGTALSASAAANSSGGSDGTETHEHDDAMPMQQQPPQKAMAALTGEVASVSDAGTTQVICSARASANRSSTTKAATGCQTPGDGSNIANGHGSNNGNVVSTNHHYAFCSPDGSIPLQQAHCSIDGPGSGNSRWQNGVGSGQGSGSGNEDLACRQLTSKPAQLHPSGAAATAAEQMEARDIPDQRRGSNGNSCVGDAARNAVVAAHREIYDASMRGTAQEKRETPAKPAANAAPRFDAAQQPGSSPTLAVRQGHQQDGRHDGSTSGSAPVGFRAWVSQSPNTGGTSSVCQNQHASIGLKRKASYGLSAPLRPVPSSAGSTRSNANLSSLPAPSPRMQQFSSCGNTAASDGTGTHFGSGGGGNDGLESSVARVVSSAFNKAAPHSAPNAAVVSPPTQPLESLTSLRPPPSLLSVDQPSRNSAEPAVTPSHGFEALQHVKRFRQASLDGTHHPTQQQQQASATAAAGTVGSEGQGGAWNSAFDVALQQQLHQLQTQQSQQHQQHQQMKTQFRNASASGKFQFGGMPSHLMTPGYVDTPFSGWDSYATAAHHANVNVQQQQQHLLSFAQQMQQQVGQQPGQPASEAAQSRFAQQHMQLQAQQMMMTGFNPAFLMGGQFNMGGNMPGGFGNFQAGWAHAQQAHMQQQLQQWHGSMAGPHTSTAAGASMGVPIGHPSQRQQQQHHQGQPAEPHCSTAVSPFSLHPSNRLAGGASGQQHPQPSAVVGDSDANDAVNDDSGNSRQPTSKEFRAQAWSKFKEKRKNLNFTKKIRYESRKQLAHARTRIKGQFVRFGSDAQAVEHLVEGPLPPTSAALAAAVAAGTARSVPQEEAAAMGLSQTASRGALAAAVDSHADDGNSSDTASDALSPRAAAPTGCTMVVSAPPTSLPAF